MRADPPGRQALPPDLARLLHELRGPLNSLTMHAQLLRRAVSEDPPAAESLRTVLAQLGSLSQMLADAFAVAALERTQAGPVDLGAIVEAARRDVEPAATVAEGPWPPVAGDAALLQLALGHLLRNAVEATAAVPGSRPPVVSAAVEAAATAVSVRDWGPGLRATDPKLLIRPWHSTKPGHRGVGLVAAERVARLHHGALRFTALPDGASVSLLLPRSA
jgi:signal transduction histidine kinase